VHFDSRARHLRFCSFHSQNMPRLRQGATIKIYAPARSVQISSVLDTSLLCVLFRMEKMVD
jgi:hypothetical protein